MSATELGRGSLRPLSTCPTQSSLTNASDAIGWRRLGLERRCSTILAARISPPAGGRLPFLARCSDFRAIRRPVRHAVTAGCHGEGCA